MLVVLSTDALLALATLGLSAPGASTAHAASADQTAKLHIVRPTNGGPVGATVVVELQSAPASQQFTLGYAPDPAGCAAGATPIAGAPTLVTAADGIGKQSFTWPSDASQAGTSYDVCATDQADSTIVLQSDNQFQVLGGSAPSITIVPVASPTVTPGGTPQPSPGPSPTPTGSPPPGGIYTVDQQVQIQGQNFLPPGTKLGIFIGGTPTVGPDSRRLPLVDTPDNTVTSDDQGAFSVIVTLSAPDTVLGLRYLHAATLDGTARFPPTLDGAQEIYLSPVATPTPLPSPTATIAPPAQTPTPTTTGSPQVARTLGIAGLGGLSIVLLMTGVLLLVSARSGSVPGAPPGRED
jgi:hypothetical protein